MRALQPRCKHMVLVGFAAAIATAVQPICALAAVEQPAAVPASPHPYGGHVTDAARRFGLPESWILAVMRVESAGNAHALSSAGAMGLMQLMPATWATLRARYRLGVDPYDPRDNILAGAAYLREMYDRYGAAGMLIAYNAGPGRYEDHAYRGRSLPLETRVYVARLSPIMDGAIDPTIAPTALATQRSWTQASLFAGRADVRSEAPERPSASPARDQPAVASEPARSTEFASGKAPLTALFVPLSGRAQ